MSKSKPIFNPRLYSVAALALLAGGFLLAWWPLCLLGLLVAAAAGQYVAALCIGLLLDLWYGAPVGSLHWLQAPLTLLSIILCALHYYLSAFVRGTDSGRL